MPQQFVMIQLSAERWVIGQLDRDAWNLYGDTQYRVITKRLAQPNVAYVLNQILDLPIEDYDAITRQALSVRLD